jgi:excisionase family DNA binding protein
MSQDEKVTYTAVEVEKILGLSRNSVYEGLHSGQIPCVKVGRRFLIPKAAVDRWLMSGSTATVPLQEK